MHLTHWHTVDCVPCAAVIGVELSLVSVRVLCMVVVYIRTGTVAAVDTAVSVCVVSCLVLSVLSIEPWTR